MTSYLASFLASILTFSLAFYPAFFCELPGIYSDILSGILSGIPTGTWRLVEVRQCPLRSGARGSRLALRSGPPNPLQSQWVYLLSHGIFGCQHQPENFLTWKFHAILYLMISSLHPDPATLAQVHLPAVAPGIHPLPQML